MAWAVTGPVFCAQAALEQQRHRRVPLTFVVVIGDDQGNAVLVAPDPGDDGAEHVGQLGADDQQPLGVGFGRGDLQQRDELAGSRQPVLHQAVVGQFGQFLDADPRMPQDLNGGPGPEPAMFFEGEVAAFPGAGLVSPDSRASLGGHH